MCKITSSEIFTPGKIPDCTYNNRQEIELEENIKLELDYGGKIITITGPTKIGKTVLVRKCLPKNKLVLIQSEDLKDAILEEAIASLIEIPCSDSSVTKTSETRDSKASVEGEIGLCKSFLQLFKAKICVSANVEVEKHKEKEVTLEYKNNLLKEATKYLIENEYILAFDDFHYISPSEQKRIIHKLKPYLLDNLKVCLILIPNRGQDVVKAEPDMEGRIRNIKIPKWKPKELEFIPIKGFEKLKLKLPYEIISSFVENSFSNPYLMQEICANFCKCYKIKEENDCLKELKICIDDLHKVYSNLPSTNVILLEKLKAGKLTKGRKRSLYKTKDGTQLDLYRIILKGLAEEAHKEDITIGSFVDLLNKLCMESEKEIRRSDVVSTLKKMVEICKGKSPLEPALDYNTDTEKIIINDPFFRFAVRWQI